METQIADWTRLGSALREARLSKGLTQSALADVARVSRPWVSKVEGGHRGAELEPLLRLISALDLTLAISPVDRAPLTDIEAPQADPAPHKDRTVAASSDTSTAREPMDLDISPAANRMANLAAARGASERILRLIQQHADEGAGAGDDGPSDD